MEQTTRFKRIERLSEVVFATVIVLGLVIIQLPLSPAPDKVLVYWTFAAWIVFTLIWHPIRLPFSPFVKYLIELLVNIGLISLIVHATGGLSSYFIFLYLFPAINVSITTNKKFTLFTWLIITVLVFGETFFFEQVVNNATDYFRVSPISLAALISWAVGLACVYGSYLAREVKGAQELAVDAVIEKEKAINKLKDEFLFIISHELRGPITVIRGYLELLVTDGVGEVSPAVKNLANSAFRQSNRLNNLIAELLDLSRLETEKIKFTNESFEINEFLKQALAESKLEAEERKIKFTYAPSQAQTKVYADKERVREIVNHLIENAFRHTGQFGQVWVGVNNQVNKIFVSVADTGVGFSPTELAKLFDKFHNSDGETDKRQDSGLGLYLIKQLVEKMGGQMFAESQVGKGSNFTFTLPATKS
jgi:signal transduction histidine kinase